MRVMVIGAGAREHALAWKLAQSPQVTKVYAAPGNPGMAECAELVNIDPAQRAALADLAAKEGIDLTVVGPELPLIEGLVDVFRQRGLNIFGPDSQGAALEGSKAFAKELMAEAGIPSAQHRTFMDAKSALAYLEEHGAPVVVKASGNAAGKGAIVALDMQTAREAIDDMLVKRAFGAAGLIVVIEDYLQGDEISVTAACHGTHYLPLATTQDHKRAFDHDQGLNTGGMGAYTPLPFVDEETEKRIYREITAATLQAMRAKGITFTGILYTNIMLTGRGPMVIEHNTRFGDPETQAMMLLMREDLVNVLQFAETLPVKRDTLWHPGYAISLSLASGGYPGDYRKGLPISGVEEANRLPNVHVFHAGTALKDGQLVTAGGRVLSVAARGATLREATERAYEAARLISFEGMFYRHDIAHRGLEAEQALK
ncbi:MAG TPA: phosphoribosylamine--glycine ligase [Ktedonobacteraceae bacterium]|nr:phosphoribosylamine--glycine ligase [Ktedonobacteraceae bacterium]